MSPFATALIAATLLSTTPVHVLAQAAPTPVLSAWEASLAADFVAALNAADPSKRAAWTAANVTPAASADMAKVIEELKEATDGKPVRLHLAVRRPSAIRLNIEVLTPNPRTANIELRLDKDDPVKVSRATLIYPWNTPYPIKPAAYASPAALSNAIADRVTFAADRDQFSGTVLVVRGEEVIFQGAYGLADKDFAVPNTMETRFHLGSMPKMFTALSIGQLIEQGKLTLDSRLIHVLPDYPNKDAAQKITIRHLLTHTSGLGGLFERKGYVRLKPFQRVAEELPAFATEPLYFEPGTSARYSNEGFIVLGAVIEKLSGESWYDYVRTHIYAPAGMTRTDNPRIDEVSPLRAMGYRYAESDLLGVRARQPNVSSMGYRGDSCGGAYSTAADMIAFHKALAADKLVSPQTLAMLTKVEPKGIGNYGMGFQSRVENGKTVRGHDGGGPHSGVNSDAKIIVEGGYIYAVLGNYDSPFAQNLGQDIAAILTVQP